MPVKMVNQVGSIMISEHTLATIAGSAVYDCKGVVGLPVKKISDGVIDFLGIENISKGVKVHTEENKVFVDVYIIVEYGVKISDVAQMIIEAVKSKLESLAGFEVSKVNVFIEGIKVEK